jgi:hypothetical protein
MAIERAEWSAGLDVEQALPVSAAPAVQAQSSPGGIDEGSHG